MAALSLWQVPWLKQSGNPLPPHARSPPGLCNVHQVRRLRPAAAAIPRGRRRRCQGLAPPHGSLGKSRLSDRAGQLLRGNEQRKMCKDGRGGSSRGMRDLDWGSRPDGGGTKVRTSCWSEPGPRGGRQPWP